MGLRNIGPKMAERLYQIGIRSSLEVIQHQPEELYERLNNGFRRKTTWLPTAGYTAVVVGVIRREGVRVVRITEGSLGVQ